MHMRKSEQGHPQQDQNTTATPGIVTDTVGSDAAADASSGGPASEALAALIVPGTDADVVLSYASLAKRAHGATHGLFEDEVVVMDTETTGLFIKDDELIEIAAVRLKGPTVIDSFQTYVDPGRRIPAEITRLTGISDADVKGAPDPTEATARLASFVRGADLVAHNAPFDRAFVMRHATASQRAGDLRGDWLDSLELARIVLPRLRGHALDALASAFGTASPTHDAIDDTAALAGVWRILLQAAADLPAGILSALANMQVEVDWPLRKVFSHLAAANPDAKLDIKLLRDTRVRADQAESKEDAEGRGMLFPETAVVEAGFTPEGVVGRMYPGYEPRPEQVAMAREVIHAFQTSTHRAIEAGTGVGKSIAYLLPSVLTAQRDNVTVGVSTRTNALMDQFVYHEIPRLSAALREAPRAQGQPVPAPLRSCALKGYDHYPCLRKLEALVHAPSTGDPQTDARTLTMVAALLTFTAQSSWGDLDTVPLFWRDYPRDEVVCKPGDCLHGHCAYFPQRCYLHGVRQRAKSADIVVTNHALLFRDITVDHGILPPIRHWIVDEAHTVEGEARRQLSPSIACSDLDHVFHQLVGSSGVLSTVRRKAARFEGGALLQGPCAVAEAAVSGVQVISESFWSFVKDLEQVAEHTDYEYVDLWISAQVRESGPWGVVASTGASLHKRLEALVKALRDIISMAEQFSAEVPGEIADLAGIASNVYEMKAALGLVLDGTDEHYVYSAHLNRRPDVRAETLCAEMVDVGEALVEGFYPNVQSVVFTSATISTGSGNVTGGVGGKGRVPSATAAPFAHFSRAVGLDRLDGDRWSSLHLDSGYDFENNMAVYVPSNMPEPADRSGYLPALEELLFSVHTAMGGSVLTLFTNRREMEHTYARLQPRLNAAGIGLICQVRGTSARRLREEFLANESLSLFALRSFWEGFDAPGDTLRCVVITKLPFARPNDPLSQERRLRDAQSWNHYVLPEAIIDFKQAAGRLIRSSTDSGCLVLPDARLVTKFYGRAFLAALPTPRYSVLTCEDIARDIENRFGR